MADLHLFQCGPDPAFYPDADPNPGIQTNADKSWYGEQGYRRWVRFVPFFYSWRYILLCVHSLANCGYLNQPPFSCWEQDSFVQLSLIAWLIGCCRLWRRVCTPPPCLATRCSATCRVLASTRSPMSKRILDLVWFGGCGGEPFPLPPVSLSDNSMLRGKFFPFMFQLMLDFLDEKKPLWSINRERISILKNALQASYFWYLYILKNKHEAVLPTSDLYIHMGS